MWDLIIKNGRILTMDSSKELNKSLLIKDGLIADIVENSIAEKLDACRVVDAEGLVVMPGIVDCHTHLCEYATQGVHQTVGKSQKMAAVSNFLDCLKSGITTLGEHILGHPVLSTTIEELKETASQTALTVKFATGTCCVGTEPLSYTSAIRPGSSLTQDDFDDAHYAGLAAASDFPGENIFITATVANLPVHLVPNGGKRIFDSDDINKIVKIFHSLGKKIGAHIEGADNIKMFLDANGDVIHHGHGAEPLQYMKWREKMSLLWQRPTVGQAALQILPRKSTRH